MPAKQKCYSCNKVKPNVELCGDDMLCRACEVKNAAELAKLRPSEPPRDTALSTKQKSPASHSCPQCHESTDLNCIVCSICCDSFHQECTGMSAKAYDVLMSVVTETGWVCGTCRSTSKSKMSELQSSLARTNETLSDLMAVVDKLKSDTDSLKYSQNVIHASTVTDHDTTVTPHTDTHQHATLAEAPSSNAVEISKIVHDLNRRKRNVVVSGLPESACESLHDQQSADSVSFTQLCEENLPVKPSISKQGCKRLGRRNDDAAKPRKLLVYLNSESAATSLTECAKELRKSDDLTVASTIFINPDLSPAEARLAFEVRQKRRERYRNTHQHLMQSTVDTHDTTPTLPTAAAVAGTVNTDACTNTGHVHSDSDIPRGSAAINNGATSSVIPAAASSSDSLQPFRSDC